MLPEVGIVITLGTADIGKCHLITKQIEELKMRKESFMMFNNSLDGNCIQDKVS